MIKKKTTKDYKRQGFIRPNFTNQKTSYNLQTQ